MKYFLGYGKEWHRIAGAVKENYLEKEIGINKNGPNNKSNPNTTEKKPFLIRNLNVNANKYCKKAAEEVLRLDFNTKEKAYSYYRMINEKVEFMENARRGFYCMLCSVEGQRAIDTWTARGLNNMRFTQPFCTTMLNYSFRINYELYNTYNLYISSIIKLSLCVSLNGNNNSNIQNKGSNGNNDFKSTNPPIQLSSQEEDAIEDPLGNKSFFAFRTCNLFSNYIGDVACIPYCTKFNIAKPSPSLDLSSRHLHQVYKHLALRRYIQWSTNPRMHL
jgi:hypothetical protein